jgi:flagella basal body P-ring formation protein FlgA
MSGLDRFAMASASRCRVVSAAVALAACSSAASAIELRAVLRERATVDAAQWRLADVAELSGVTEPVARSLGQQIVWPSPPPCHSARISRMLIEKRLRELPHGASVRLQVGGAPQIVIERRCQHLDAANVQVVARAALASWLAFHSARFEIESASALNPVDLPVGEVTLTPRAPPGHQALASRMQVWIDVGVDGVFVRSVSLAFQVRAFLPAWVATRDAHTGGSPADAALERREIDIADVRAGALDEVPGNAQLKRPLLAGQVLTLSHLETIPSVQRRSWVTVRSAIGAIDVQAQGEALQDGRAGQLVWVRLATSTGPIHARVVGPGLVEVQHE